METTIAQNIRQWRADIKLMETASDRHRAAIRVYAWNWATSPSRPMTDQEHRVCRKLAHKVWSDLQPLSHYWHEMESGCLWI